MRELIRTRDHKRPDLIIVVHKIVFRINVLDDLRACVRIYSLELDIDCITCAPPVQRGSIKAHRSLELCNRLESEMILIDALDDSFDVTRPAFSSWIVGPG